MSQQHIAYWKRVVWLVVCSILVALGAPATGFAQWPPEEFTNLRVLPQDIQQRTLSNIMRGFSEALGVRCEHCHVGEPGQPLSTFDFASDEKTAKLTAREMMRMVNAINSQHLTTIAERSDPPIEVQCATCHHGMSRPQTLERVLLDAGATGGLDAMVAKYKQLRDHYYGTWTFDFSESQLVAVAQRIGSQGQHDDAIALLNLNLEYFPQSSSSHFVIGEQFLAQGDTTAAITSYRTALDLDPGQRAARRRLSELGGG